jgi:nucleoside-triphosphatase THEP1
MTHVVLTGQVHSGKTTVCRKVARLIRQRGYCVGGILTLPILDRRGLRLGLQSFDLKSGDQRELARIDRDWGGPCAGPYNFDPVALQWGEEVIIHAIASGCDLLILDEIGRLELEQDTGFSRVLPFLSSSALLRSLLVIRATLLEAFRRRMPEFDFTPFEVTLSNRDTLHIEIAQCLFPRCSINRRTDGQKSRC